MANVNNKFKVIWRYKTPLEGRYIAQFANHMFTPGLSKDPKITYTVGDNLIRFVGLECYMHPQMSSSSQAGDPTEDDYDVICKIVSDDKNTENATPSANGVIYMTFSWLGEASSEPLLNINLYNAPGLPAKESLVLGYKYGTRIFPLGKYTTQYWRSKGVSAAFLRRSLFGEVPITADDPVQIETLLKSFTYSEVNGDPVKETYVPATLENPSTGLVKTYILPVENIVSFYDIPAPTGTTESWHLVGYNTKLTSVPTTSTKLPLTILASASTRTGLEIPAGSVAIAVVNWKGNSTDSEIFEFSNVTKSSNSEDIETILHNHALI